MKAADIRAKSADERQDQLLQLKKEQFNLRFQKAAGQTESQGRVRQVRRDIARLNTIMGQASRTPAVAAAAHEVKSPKGKRK